MSHEPRITVYTIKVKPANDTIRNSNRVLFKNIIGESENELDDSYIMSEIFRKFIASIDTPEMYADNKSRKCITANQPNIEDSTINPNIILHTETQIIEGKIEGGSYGRKRNKTSITNKLNKSNVDEGDAITEDFYFMLYTPLSSNKSVLLLQSYSDDSIDGIMKKFWQNFFSFPSQYYLPVITRFVPNAIIEDFKASATISNLTFSTEVPGETLLEDIQTTIPRNYKITVQITPIKGNMTMQEFDQSIEPIQQKLFNSLRLGEFRKKKGVLKDITTNKTSPFDLGSSFEVQPSILLSKYITINEDVSDFDRIRTYCFSLLENIKSEIYIQHAIQER